MWRHHGVSIAEAAGILAVASSLVAGVPVLAQDFSAPLAELPLGSPSSFLESGLIERGPPFALATMGTRWLGLPELSTRAVGSSLRWREVGVAIAVSRTGSSELGWNSLGWAAGTASDAWGAALRGVLRRDLFIEAGTVFRGAEVGFGAWGKIGEPARLWASAPQVWLHGAAPPLRRGVVVGAMVDASAVRPWVSRALLPGRSGARAEHALGVLTTGDRAWIWLSVRDRPARGAVGIRVRVRSIAISSQLENHPVLGTTTKAMIEVPASDAFHDDRAPAQ